MSKYIRIDAEAIQKRIEELEQEYKKELKQPSDVMCVLSKGMIGAYKDVLSQSTPLIPENIKPLQELVDEGYDPYDSSHHLQVQRMLKVIQDYISNLKLDI